jgi:hypothetical protein
LERDAFITWQALTKDRFKDMEEGWTLSGLPKSCKKLESIIGAVVSKACDDWTERGRQLASELNAASPPKPMLHNSKMLIDTAVRQSFDKAVKAMYGSKLKDVAADVHEILKKAVDALKVPITSVKLLALARRHAKLVISVNWAIGEILNFKPLTTGDLAKHGTSIFAKLKLKGFLCKDKEDFDSVGAGQHRSILSGKSTNIKPHDDLQAWVRGRVRGRTGAPPGIG